MSFNISSAGHHHNNTDHYILNSTSKLNQNVTPRDTILPDYLQLPDSYNLPDLLYHIAMSITTSEITYHTICGVLQVKGHSRQNLQLNQGHFEVF